MLTLPPVKGEISLAGVLPLAGVGGSARIGSLLLLLLFLSVFVVVVAVEYISILIIIIVVLVAQRHPLLLSLLHCVFINSSTFQGFLLTFYTRPKSAPSTTTVLSRRNAHFC